MKGDFKKNYFTYLKSYKYLLVCTGILFLGILCGISIMISTFTSSWNSMVDNLKNTYEESDLSFGRIGNAFEYSFTGEGQVDTVKDAVSNTFDNYFNFITGLLMDVVHGVLGLVGGILLLVFFLFFTGYACASVLNYRLRYVKKKRNILRLIVARLLHNTTMVTATLPVIALLFVCPAAAVIMVILSPITYCVLALVSATTSFGENRPNFKSVLTIRNILRLLALNFADLGTALVAAALCILIFFFSIPAGIVLALSSLILTAGVIGTNADAIVVDVSMRSTEEAPEEEEKTEAEEAPEEEEEEEAEAEEVPEEEEEAEAEETDEDTSDN